MWGQIPPDLVSGLEVEVQCRRCSAGRNRPRCHERVRRFSLGCSSALGVNYQVVKKQLRNPGTQHLVCSLLKKAEVRQL